MKYYKKLLTMLLFSSLLFQGCKENESKHPPVIGSAVSIISDDKQAQMAPSTQALNEISYTIATVLKLQLDEINHQESSTVTTTLRYCDIAGLKSWESSNSKFNINYEACQTTNAFQDGVLELYYKKDDDRWLYPHEIELHINKKYTFNSTQLEENLSAKSIIDYKYTMQVNRISFRLTGLINFDHQTIKLDNYQSTITF